MEFLFLVYEDHEQFAKVPDAEKRRVSDACNVWHEKLKQSGHARAMTRLHVVATAATVRRADKTFLVTDGPFAETKELLGGYAVVECRDRDEAIELAKTFPVLEVGLAVEVRPIMTTGEDARRWRPA